MSPTLGEGPRETPLVKVGQMTRERPAPYRDLNLHFDKSSGYTHTLGTSPGGCLIPIWWPDFVQF